MRKLLVVILTLVLVVGIVGCNNVLEDSIFTLTVETVGNGNVIPEEGTHSLDKDTIVDLKATPAEYYEFSHWEGDVADSTNTETTTVMDGDKTVTAHFEQKTSDIELTNTYSGDFSNYFIFDYPTNWAITEERSYTTINTINVFVVTVSRMPDVEENFTIKYTIPTEDHEMSIGDFDSKVLERENNIKDDQYQEFVDGFDTIIDERAAYTIIFNPLTGEDLTVSAKMYATYVYHNQYIQDFIYATIPDQYNENIATAIFDSIKLADVF